MWAKNNKPNSTETCEIFLQTSRDRRWHQEEPLGKPNGPLMWMGATNLHTLAFVTKLTIYSTRDDSKKICRKFEE